MCAYPSAKAGVQGNRFSPWAPRFPLARRAVRGKLSIGKIELVVGRRTWSRWGQVDGGHGSTFEQACSHQVGKAQRQQARPALARGNAQKQVGDHGGENLQANGVFGTAKKASDFEMLFDPSKQQLDLPAFAVERGDLTGWPRDFIAQDSQQTAVL